LKGEHRARQAVDRRSNGGGRTAGSARHRRSRRHDRSWPVMPLLRRPHDHCRGPCPRLLHRVARPPAPGPAPEPMTLLIFSCQHPLAGTSRAQRRTSFIPASASAGRTPQTSSQSARRIRRQLPLRKSSAAFSSQQSSQNRLPATPLSRQIPIDGQLPTAFPRVLSSEAFGRRPDTGSSARARAGIRNPSRKRSLERG
jgi:hypothetical protein